MYPDLYFQLLLDRLQDNDAMVRARAANALGMVNQQPEKAVPALIKALDDPDHWVRCMAALGLSLYGTQAKSAVPAVAETFAQLHPTRSKPLARQAQPPQ
jgi:HEAT repeat protein